MALSLHQDPTSAQSHFLIPYFPNLPLQLDNISVPDSHLQVHDLASLMKMRV